jgi:LysR family transcriptional activator of nhaA
MTPFPDLNLHHLRYAWVVAREGSITGAARRLGVAPSTVSAQVAALEARLGFSLFIRRGNRLELTAEGDLVQRYAGEIVGLTDRLVHAVTGDAPGQGRAGHPPRATRLAVGITETLPILTAHALLAPVLALPPEALRLTVRVGAVSSLLGDLGSRVLDVILTDAPVSPSAPVRVVSRHLADSTLTLFAAPALAERLAPEFPRSLDGAPFLLHTENAALRAALDGWFVREGIRPLVTAEVEDVGLLQLLGQDGRGVFAAPSLVAERIEAHYGVRRLGAIEGVLQRFDAVLLPNREANPALEALLSGAAR